MTDVGKMLYDRRKELGLTLEEVGQAVGVGKSTVRKWENGLIKNMGRDKIVKLARVLQLSPVDLVPGDPQGDELTNDERSLIELYRNAEDSARQIARETLQNHQKKDTAVSEMA